MNIFLCRESTPTQVSATSLVKEDISYQWIIFDAKMIHTRSSNVHGPSIHSKFLPCPMKPNLYFTENSVIFELYGRQLYETVADSYRDVCICNCIITILSMETKQSIFSVKVPKQRIHLLNVSDSATSFFSPIRIKLMDYDNFSTYLNDEALTIQVLATLTKYSQHTDISVVVNNYNRMKWSFDDASFTDCIIRVQNKILKVHKVILASASEVFRQMLADSSDNAIEPSDVDFEDVSDIVAYIYTGTATNVRSRTSKILVAADCFDLRNLVGECVYELQCRFTPANVVNSLCLAGNLTSYGHHLLKTACIDFIKPNFMSVYLSDSWKALKETHCALALEIAMEVLK